jgi:hypothetical protein
MSFGVCVLTAIQMNTIHEDDVFLCPESRDRIRHSVYELRLSAMMEVFKGKIAEVDRKTKQLIEALPEGVRNSKVSSFK